MDAKWLNAACDHSVGTLLAPMSCTNCFADRWKLSIAWEDLVDQEVREVS